MNNNISNFLMAMFVFCALSCQKEPALNSENEIFGLWEVKGHNSDIYQGEVVDVFYDLNNVDLYHVISNHEGFESFSFVSNPLSGGFWEWNSATRQITFYHGLSTIEKAIEYNQVLYWDNIVIDGEYLEATVYDGIEREAGGGVILKRVK